MVLRMQLLESLARHMGVDRCGRYIGMPQQHLHRAQASAVVEQVRSEGMAQRVR